MSSSSNFDATRDRVIPQRQHSTEEVRKLFGKGSNATLANEVFRTNRAYYESVRRQAQADGIIDAPREHSLAKHYRQKHALENPVYDEQTIRARAMFSPEVVDQYLKSQREFVSDTLSRMKAERPAEYEAFRLAAISYDKIAPSAPRPERERPLLEQLAESVSDKIRISDDLANRLNLPIGYMVAADDLSKLVQIAAEIQLAKQEAERDAKLKAEAESTSKDAA